MPLHFVFSGSPSRTFLECSFFLEALKIRMLRSQPISFRFLWYLRNPNPIDVLGFLFYMYRGQKQYLPIRPRKRDRRLGGGGRGGGGGGLHGDGQTQPRTTMHLLDLEEDAVSATLATTAHDDEAHSVIATTLTHSNRRHSLTHVDDSHSLMTTTLLHSLTYWRRRWRRRQRRLFVCVCVAVCGRPTTIHSCASAQLLPFPRAGRTHNCVRLFVCVVCGCVWSTKAHTQLCVRPA